MAYPISLVAGSTGFVGSKVLSVLEKRKGDVFSLSRKKNEHITGNAEELIINFDELLDSYDFPNVNHVYLCLGHQINGLNLLYMNTELRKSFYKVDYQYQIAVAKEAIKSGAECISFISSVGADSKSNNFYLKTKGEVENKIIEMECKSINFFQPGHISDRIRWQRKIQKPRADVYAADMMSFFLDPFMTNKLKKFRSISVKSLSEFIVTKTREENIGINYYDYSDFKS